MPAHSFKFAAEMQYAQGGDAPILIRIDTKAGHGAGKPVSKRIEEATDVFSFLFENTDTPYKTVENENNAIPVMSETSLKTEFRKQPGPIPMRVRNPGTTKVPADNHTVFIER